MRKLETRRQRVEMGKEKRGFSHSFEMTGGGVGVEDEEGLEIQAEVVPVGIERLDQGDFLGAAPLFDFFFTRYCRANVGVGLEPDEFGDVVLFCEAREDFCLVLANAVRQVAGYAKVEDAGLAGHEVDVEGTVHEGKL
jgi:hypothetical protein